MPQDIASRVSFLAILFAMIPRIYADELPRVEGVPAQPLAAQVRRLVETLELQGQPLAGPARTKLDGALGTIDPTHRARMIQEVLDPLCLFGVTINPEGRVGVIRGPRAATLGQHEWRIFPVKVHNSARIAADLTIKSPNAEPVFRVSTSSPRPTPGLSPIEVADRWLDLAWVASRPMIVPLSGLVLEYRPIQVYSRDPGPREAKIRLDTGEGTQDLGFRGEIDVLFTSEPAVPVTLDVRDVDGRPTIASFVFRDSQGRTYPSASRRLAPYRKILEESADD